MSNVCTSTVLQVECPLTAPRSHLFRFIQTCVSSWLAWTGNFRAGGKLNSLAASHADESESRNSPTLATGFFVALLLGQTLTTASKERHILFLALTLLHRVTIET